MKERRYGLDLCRILAMLGIVLLHIQMKGGILTNVPLGSIEYWILWFIEIVSYGAVNVFGLLSGYLLIYKDKYSSYRLLDLLFSVCFYSFIITLLFGVFKSDVFVDKKWYWDPYFLQFRVDIGISQII